jgi:phosphohistidine phosphatase
MKTLLLMRHAKSSWDNAETSDFERPLNEIGLKTAPFMGSIIYQNGLQPELIISSPAKRAKQTAVLIKAVAEISAKIEYRDELYGARPTAFLEVTSGIVNKYDSVLLIGHNPELENFINKLTGENQSMRTASIAVIKLNVGKWSEISVGCGKLELVLRPADLMERVEIEPKIQTA